MKTKDLLLSLILLVGIVVFFLGLMALEGAPYWVFFVLAVLLWAAYILMSVRDRTREKRRMEDPRIYLPIDDQIQEFAYTGRSVQKKAELFDQEEGEKR